MDEASELQTSDRRPCRPLLLTRHTAYKAILITGHGAGPIWFY